MEEDEYKSTYNELASVRCVFEKYGSLGQLPYSEIIQSVEQFQGRRRRQR